MQSASTYIDTSLIKLNAASIISSNVLSKNMQAMSNLTVGGNVGIGTNNPQAAVHLHHETSSTDFLVNQNGQGNIMELRSNNASKVIFNTQGNVGIGTTLARYTLHVPNGDIYIPGMVLQTVTTNYTQQTSYSAPGTLTPTEITVLNLTITPKRADSKIILDWTINADVHWDVVFLVYRGSTLIGYNTTQGNQQWSGVVSGWYDQSVDSSCANFRVLWVDTPGSTSTTTYSVRIRSSSATAYTLYLNRTQTNVGANTYEALCSLGTAWEVCV